MRRHGWRGAEMCDCLKVLCAQEQIGSSPTPLNLGEAVLDRFQLEWYGEQLWPGEDGPPGEHGVHLRGMPQLRPEIRAVLFQKPVFKRRHRAGQNLSCPPVSPARLGETAFRWCTTPRPTSSPASKLRSFPGGGGLKAPPTRQAVPELRPFDPGRPGQRIYHPFVQSALYQLLNSRLTVGRLTVHLLQPLHGPGAGEIHPAGRFPPGGGVPGTPFFRRRHSHLAQAEAVENLNEKGCCKNADGILQQPQSVNKVGSSG